MLSHVPYWTELSQLGVPARENRVVRKSAVGFEAQRSLSNVSIAQRICIFHNRGLAQARSEWSTGDFYTVRTGSSKNRALRTRNGPNLNSIYGGGHHLSHIRLQASAAESLEEAPSVVPLT
jgi:hypothetical protein